MHDTAFAEGCALKDAGLALHHDGTLVERALTFLRDGPQSSRRLADQVLGLPRAPALVADRIAVALLGGDARVQRLHDGRWTLVAATQGSPRLSECSFAVVDVETTGTRAARGDRVIEIGIVIVNAAGVTPIFHSLVNPERPISRIVSRVTRISDKMVREQPTFDEIADDVMAALAGRVFVAHNARFDWVFVSRELRRTRHWVLDGPRLCTVQLTRRLLPGLRYRDLDSVAQYFGVSIEERHRAGSDALATAHVLQALVRIAEEQGVVTLDELKRTTRRKRRKKSAMPRSMDAI